MKTLMSASLAAIASAALFSLPSASEAQQLAPKPFVEWKPAGERISPTQGLVAQMKSRGETPTMADGRPDFTGYWGGGPIDAPYTDFGSRGLQYFEPDQAAMQRGNNWSRPVYKPEYWEKVYNLDYGKVGDDPAYHCAPNGVPRLGMANHIVATPTEVILFNRSASRSVPLDGRERDPQDQDYELYDGWPLGHWDGDVLVIESTGFNDLTWMQWTGYFHSNLMEVTERYWRKGDLLYYNFTASDPEVLEQPWTSETYVKRLSRNPTARTGESAPCVENDLDNIPDVYFRG